MEQIINQIVSSSISIIIGLFLIDLMSRMFLDFSIIAWFKKIFNKNKTKIEITVFLTRKSEYCYVWGRSYRKETR